MSKRIKKKVKQEPLYGKTCPCATCPYQKSAKLQLWNKSEFVRLLEMEKDFMGTIYGCHKKDGSVCRGWLIDQDKRNFPSLSLRISLSKNNVNRKYLDSLQSEEPLFDTVEEMCLTNYPELKLNA